MYRTIKDPRLFVVRSDNSGYELLSQKQLASYFREKERVHEKVIPRTFLLDSTKYFETNKLVGMETSKAIGFLTRIFTLKDQLLSLNLMKDIEIPRIIDSLQESAVLQKEPPKELFKYRCLLVHPELDGQKRQQFENDLRKYRRWKEKFENTRKALIIRDARTGEEIAEEKRIQEMIMNMRKGIDAEQNKEKEKEKKNQKTPQMI